MSAILSLVQGTPEWHAHRAKSRNASETAVVLGVSPWQTPYQLWSIRTGRTTQEVTKPMQHGAALEGAARLAYEQRSGLVLEPLVLVEGDYSASLDGITLEGDLILEIKCPYKGRDSELWKAVATGTVPENYGWQIEHQLMVSGAAKAHLWVFDGKEGLLVEVVPKPETWLQIANAWDVFMTCIATNTPPPLTDRDTRERDDAEWKAAAEAYLRAKQEAEHSAAVAEEAKAALIALASHPIESGAGVKVTRFLKQGVVDYKKVPQLKGVDLEPYRKETRIEVRVTAA
jgi:putative phage-type endonuclease